MEYTQQPVYDIISIARIRYSTETVIQIFKSYSETRIHCYVGIISRILTDSYRMNKREYGLFIESLYNDIPESYSKNIQENFVLYSPVFYPNTGEYGAKKTRIHGVFFSQFPLAWYANIQRKSSETSSISKKLFPIVESLPERRRGIKNKKLQAYKRIFPLLEELLRYLDSTLSLLINLSLCLQRAEPLIHILYDSPFSCNCLLLSRFGSPGLI